MRSFDRSRACVVARSAIVGYATFRIWEQGQRDEQRPADAIVVLGAAQYDGRPSPVFEARSTTRSSCITRASRRSRRDRRQGRGRPDDRGRRRARATRSTTASRSGDPRRGREPDDARVDPRSSATLMRTTGSGQRGLRVRPDPHAPGPADGAGRRASRRTARRPARARRADPVRRVDATIHELGALAVYFLSGGAP